MRQIKRLNIGTGVTLHFVPLYVSLEIVLFISTSFSSQDDTTLSVTTDGGKFSKNYRSSVQFQKSKLQRLPVETKGMLAQCVLLARERGEIDIVGV